MRILKLNEWHIDFTKNKRKLEEYIDQLPLFFEDEILSKKKIVDSIIKMKKKKGTIIHARQCDIRLISNEEKNEFLNDNHLQGKDNSSVRIGLFNNSRLVSIMTFGKSRFNKNYEYELIRYCTLLNTRVLGGFSRMEKFFIDRFSPKSIITFADRRFSRGDVYLKNGYVLLRKSAPNYFYFTKKQKVRMSRNRFQKHKLNKVLKNFDSSKTEWENMRLHGYLRIYDLGNLCFIKEFNNVDLQNKKS